MAVGLTAALCWRTSNHLSRSRLEEVGYYESFGEFAQFDQLERVFALLCLGG